MNKSALNLLKFKPTVRNYVWGGRSLLPFAGAVAAKSDEPIAEIWTIYENNKIDGGEFDGVTLKELTARYPSEILGRQGDRFPLLVKILDCAQWLSLQVHPNDLQAQTLEGPGFLGKTEAWHILNAANDAKLIAGIKQGTSGQTLRAAIGSKDILDLVEYHNVKRSDTVFMPAGTIHALGPGLLIYEVQQTSDLTYRVYDWDRPQINGRTLHIDKAAAVADASAQGRVIPGKARTEAASELISSPFFHLEKLTGTQTRDTGGESFHAITVTSGEALVASNGDQCRLGQFESLLVPAASRAYQLEGEFEALCSSAPS